MVAPGYYWATFLLGDRAIVEVNSNQKVTLDGGINEFRVANFTDYVPVATESDVRELLELLRDIDEGMYLPKYLENRVKATLAKLKEKQ